MLDLSTASANADNGPLSDVEMIKQIDGKAPVEATRMLTQFRNVNWKASTSHVHRGIHAVRRQVEGYPLQFLKKYQVIQLDQ